MIRITYSREQQSLAEIIRDDLGAAETPALPTLLVLISAQSITDPNVLAEVDRAKQECEFVLPILTEHVTLPPQLAIAQPLDFSAGYNRERLRQRLAQETAPPDHIRRANRRALAVIGAIVALMFCLAIVAMIRGYVAFPVAEYNEEATFQAEWVDGLIRETLDYVAPRSTEDAQNFAATYEAAPTRLYFYVRGTATAMAQRQED